MSTIVPTISGPKRPQDKVLLTNASSNFKKVFSEVTKKEELNIYNVEKEEFKITDGDVLIFHSPLVVSVSPKVSAS